LLCLLSDLVDESQGFFGVKRQLHETCEGVFVLGYLIGWILDLQYAWSSEPIFCLGDEQISSSGVLKIQNAV